LTLLNVSVIAKRDGGVSPSGFYRRSAALFIINMTVIGERNDYSV